MESFLFSAIEQVESVIGVIEEAVFAATKQLDCTSFQSRLQLSTTSYHVVLFLHIRASCEVSSPEGPKPPAPYFAKEHAQR